MSLGERIRAARKEKGMTQKQLGAGIGVSQAAIGQFENGESNPKVSTLQKIADALEIPIGELIDWKDLLVKCGEERWREDCAEDQRKWIRERLDEINADGIGLISDYVEMIYKKTKYIRDAVEAERYRELAEKYKE